jgi:hypothetical protein
MGAINDLAGGLAPSLAVAPRTPRLRPATATGILTVFSLLALFVQVYGTRAVSSELGAYSDEPAHYVTAIMVRDYVSDGLPRSPVKFATDFYNRFPKVALGNWPPGLYVVLLPWLILVDDSPAAVLALVALLSGLCAGTATLILRRVVPLGVAIGIALVWLFLPLTVSLSGAVMTEVPLTLVTAVAILVWVRCLERQRLFDVLLLGVIIGIGLLIKGSALALLAMTLVGTRSGRGRGFWVARGVVLGIPAVIGGPWSWYFHDQARTGWMYQEPTLQYTVQALPFYTAALARELGWTVSAGVIVWIVATVVQRRGLNPLEKTVACSGIGILVLHLIVPAGLERRHLLPALLPFLVLSCCGYQWVLAHVGSHFARPWLAASLFSLAMIECLVGGLPERSIEGYRQALQQAQAACDAECVLLVISDANGEGTFVSEAVQLRNRADIRVLRGTKTLSSSDWAGRKYYEPLVQSAADVTALLDRQSVDFVMVDSAPGHLYEADLAAGALSGTDFSIAFQIPVHRSVDFTTHQRRQVGQITAYRYHRRSAALAQ